MSVLSRAALEGSPLADLHAIASELGVDGFRRLRKPDLIDTILERTGGDVAGEATEVAVATEERPPRARRSRTRRAPVDADDDTASEVTEAEAEAEADTDADADTDAGEPEEERAATRRPRRERSRSADERPAAKSRRNGDDRKDGGEERTIDGVVEVLANGSGFVRLTPGETHDDDVYVSAAQVRRCELVSGDRVTGPVRRPRRSERYASLVRVETINGSPADEVADGTPYDELPAAWPSDPLTFKAKDATLKQIADLAPIGRGSRVSVVGPAASGRSATLRLLAIELAAEDGIELSVVLAGARPEEPGDWVAADLTPAAVVSSAASAEAQAQAIDRAIDAARRVTARGGHAAVIVDALDHIGPAAARRALAAARNVPDGGSLTIIAASREPVGGETTILALDAEATAAERRPVLDARRSHTLRVEVLAGARKATAITKNRAKALDAPAPEA